MTAPYDPRRPALTARIAAELIAHEGIVLEAYRDSVGIWTWGVGLTDASGHRVGRYRDKPQPLSRCLEVYLWVLEHRYLPAVLAAFGPLAPLEHELAAALSFHWNTGAIARAEWMRLLREGDRVEARTAMMAWCRPVSLTARRRAEPALFFDGTWSGDGSALVYAVAKPSYRPAGGKRQAVMDTLRVLLGETGEPAPTAPVPPTSIIRTATCPATPQALPEAGKGHWFTRLFLD